MKLTTLASCLILSTALVAFAQTAPKPVRTKEVAIKELLDLSGAGKMGVQAMNQMIPSLKAMAPEAGNEFWEKFSASVDPEELTQLVVPIYAKHLSQEEVEQVIAFYKTPAGRKIIVELPAILQECMAAGQEWGRKLGERAMQEIQAEKAKSAK